MYTNTTKTIPPTNFTTNILLKAMTVAGTGPTEVVGLLAVYPYVLISDIYI